MKHKRAKKKKEHPWAELASLTSFSYAALECLHQHHKTLYRFCVDPEVEEDPSQQETQLVVRDETSSTPTSSRAIGVDNNLSSQANLALSFQQYCLCLHTLIRYGSPAQQFEYLFQTYAMESEVGISRAELFQLLQDHYERQERAIAIDSTLVGAVRPGAHQKQHDKSAKSTTDSQDPDARYFERLYTWLKKHINIYDKERKGYLPLKTALELLQMHPNALYHLRFQIDPFIRKLDDANRQYQAKAQAAAIVV